MQEVEAHKVELAKEVLDDIELRRIDVASVLLKTARLARLVSDEEMRAWLLREVGGFENSEDGRKYMTWSGRWTNKAAGLGYWGSFAEIVADSASLRTQLQQLRVPDIHFAPHSANPNELMNSPWRNPMSEVLQKLFTEQQRVTAQLRAYEGIPSRVIGRCHAFASRVYYQLAFGGVASSVFERMRDEIEQLLGTQAEAALDKLPAVDQRLQANDPEATSQAMNTCRRIIKAVADAVAPSSDKPVVVDGQTHDLGPDKILNRIEHFVREHTGSKSRADRLCENVRSIHERTSAGAHADITNSEARALFLQTFMTLGEILIAAREAGWSPPPSASSSALAKEAKDGGQGSAPPITP